MHTCVHLMVEFEPILSSDALHFEYVGLRRFSLMLANILIETLLSAKYFVSYVWLLK